MFYWAWIKQQLWRLFPGEGMPMEESLDVRLADIITDVLDNAYYNKEISFDDKKEKLIKLAEALSLPDLIPRKLEAKDQTPRSHFMIHRRKLIP